MVEPTTRKKTKNKSFRLDELESNALEQEAKDRNISASDVVSELISHELVRGRILRSRRMHQVSSLTLRLITEALPDEKIIEIAERIANDALQQDLPFEITGETSLEAIQKTMMFLAGHWSFEYNVVEHEGKKVIILAHYVSRSYSLLLGTYWKALLHSVGTDVILSVDNDAVLLRFK